MMGATAAEDGPAFSPELREQLIQLRMELDKEQSTVGDLRRRVATIEKEKLTMIAKFNADAVRLTILNHSLLLCICLSSFPHLFSPASISLYFFLLFFSVFIFFLFTFVHVSCYLLLRFFFSIIFLYFG